MAVNIKPEKYWYRQVRARLYRVQKKYAEAEVDLSEAVKLRGSDAETWYEYARAQFEAGKLKEAKETLGRYIEMLPQYPEESSARIAKAREVLASIVIN